MRAVPISFCSECALLVVDRFFLSGRSALASAVRVCCLRNVCHTPPTNRRFIFGARCACGCSGPARAYGNKCTPFLLVHDPALVYTCSWFDSTLSPPCTRTGSVACRLQRKYTRKQRLASKACYWVCLPACVCKQLVNIAQLCSASLSLALAESGGDSDGASKRE